MYTRQCFLFKFSVIYLSAVLLMFPNLSITSSETNGHNSFENGDFGQLPFCLENAVPGMVLVSTLDGRFSAINSEGQLQWQIETEPGPLLTSNIHNLELTDSGKWIRIIPSLNGALYRFDGTSIDPIHITAEALLKSSFKYSDELVIAGGYEVRTYGIGFKTGKVFYACSSAKCVNHTDGQNQVDDILLLERNTQIVRAIDSQSGNERWNFSVGHLNVKLPQVTCADQRGGAFNWNVSAIVPEGLLLASRTEHNVETTWQYPFSAPIVKVWKWNGHKVSEVDLFAFKRDSNPIFPSIYVGMHKKQLYIHESMRVGHSLGKIPWKPISATGLLTDDHSTSLSVLYSSEYVNGQGYYLYSASDIARKNHGLCVNNFTFPRLTDESGHLNIDLLTLWWKEFLLTVLTLTCLVHLMRSLTRGQLREQSVIFVEKHVPTPVVTPSNSATDLVPSDSKFTSRFNTDFDTLMCLGKGGFGVVFEVKQRIDECHYAIKRIVLPNEESKREAVMREVKALAKLEHGNIVRYFNSWVEKPPLGWKEEHDSQWIQDMNHDLESESGIKSTSYTQSSVNCNNTATNHDANDNDDSFIVFQNDPTVDKSSNNHLMETTNETTCSSQHSVSKINWKRPDRRYHNLSDNTQRLLLQSGPTFLYIQMQLCQRQSLKEWLANNTKRQFEDVLNIFYQILSAVEYVHLQGLIHRDLKPSNIFFSLDGQIKVGDFGLVKDVIEESSLENYSSSLKKIKKGHTKEVGTRLYMSPEQLSGKQYNYKVDIYSLGLIFFELLVYFNTDMERIDTLTKIKENQYPNDFTQQYENEHKLLTKMLCKKPHERLTTLGIRAQPPLTSDKPTDTTYHFQLPNSK